jgi:hypothetical protein
MKLKALPRHGAKAKGCDHAYTRFLYLRGLSYGGSGGEEGSFEKLVGSKFVESILVVIFIVAWFLSPLLSLMFQVLYDGKRKEARNSC